VCEGLLVQLFFHLLSSTGDPRIQEAKITWVGSDATSWVKHTKKASKGEPALEIVVEKGEALQNGDAWRIAMDACIPVMNLIDTRRSIPYGIQQVWKLLGIACSFDQVVQVRLLASGEYSFGTFFCKAEKVFNLRSALWWQRFQITGRAPFLCKLEWSSKNSPKIPQRNQQADAVHSPLIFDLVYF
jgi:hypothetical protein